MSDFPVFRVEHVEDPHEWRLVGTFLGGVKVVVDETLPKGVVMSWTTPDGEVWLMEDGTVQRPTR